VLIDIDDFKQVNDGYGHVAGDETLRAVAQVIMTGLRESDIVARFGGDEFAILLDRVTSDADAMKVVERVRAAVARCRIPADGAELSVTCSIGVVRMCPASGVTADALLMAADTAMYSAKTSGKNASSIASSCDPA
jgi:diguanylate cyclase (GGDEF)-like protein